MKKPKVVIKIKFPYPNRATEASSAVVEFFNAVGSMEDLHEKIDLTFEVNKRA